MTEVDYDEAFDLNMKGCLFSVQACLPALAATGHGCVVVTSSITGPMTGVPGCTHYGASKAAQLGFVRAAAMELAPQGITVNAVLPGTILSDGLLKLGMNLDEAVASIPLKRLGDPRSGLVSLRRVGMTPSPSAPRREAAQCPGGVPRLSPTASAPRNVPL